MADAYNRTTGRFSEAQSTVMKRVRKPSFVDNAVRHATYVSSATKRVAGSPVRTDFESSTDKTYTLSEEDDTIRIEHTSSGGNRFRGGVFHGDDQFDASSTVPSLFVNVDDSKQRLAPHSIETATKGTRIRLNNLKGRSLIDMGFDGKRVQIGQPIAVGLRTSDLAERIVTAGRKTLSGFRISAPSNVFVAKNINNVDALTALRYLSRHDGFMVKADAQGMASYIHQLRGNKSVFVHADKVAEGINEGNMVSAPNRVTVRGKSRANNDDNVVQVDDIESQKDGVREVQGGIFAPTANNRNSTKNIGRKFLATAKRAKGAKILKGTINAMNVRAGDMLSFQDKNEKTQDMVLKVRHHLTKKHSDIQVSSIEGTLEDLVQRAQEGDISSMFDDGQERNQQITEENFSVSGTFSIKTSWVLAARQIRPEGMIIGHPTRGLIKGDGALPSADSVFVTLGNPQGRWVIKGRG
jgi:hypothetical protein